MGRAFVPVAILAIILLLCLCGRVIAPTTDPIFTVNATRRPRIGTVR